MSSGSSGPSEELAVMARRRIAELELDLHRWRRVLALSQTPAAQAPAPRTPTARSPSQAVPVRVLAPIAQIIATVAARYGVTREELLAHGRTQPATTARQVAMRLARELTGKSYPEIGRAFSRDHATVIHACEVTESFALNDLREELRSALGLGDHSEAGALV
jgi:chromosomal replication initiator protein